MPNTIKKNEDIKCNEIARGKIISCYLETLHFNFKLFICYGAHITNTFRHLSIRRVGFGFGFK